MVLVRSLVCIVSLHCLLVTGCALVALCCLQSAPVQPVIARAWVTPVFMKVCFSVVSNCCAIVGAVFELWPIQCLSLYVCACMHRVVIGNMLLHLNLMGVLLELSPAYSWPLEFDSGQFGEANSGNRFEP